MFGPPRVQSMNISEPEARPVLGPGGNKSRAIELKKPIVKPKSEKTQRPQDTDETKGNKSPAALQSPGMSFEKIPSPRSFRKNWSTAASILSKRQQNLSLNASCSSDVSSDSSHSRASTGRFSKGSGPPSPQLRKKQQCSSICNKIELKDGCGKNVAVESDSVVVDSTVVKKRCAWVTSNTDRVCQFFSMVELVDITNGLNWQINGMMIEYGDPLYASFHDEEWGLPVHDDKKLFELLSFSTSLAELTWPLILSRRQLFRDVFLDFDPIAVSKLNEKKISTLGSPASSLLSELKLRAIIENARQICKIIDEFGCFDKYIWGFVKYKPIVGNFRYGRQVPMKTSKADAISKDLVRRGFRGVGQTVVYSFMQVAGITNDHIIGCFRHQECIIGDDLNNKNVVELELVRDIDDLSLSS